VLRAKAAIERTGGQKKEWGDEAVRADQARRRTEAEAGVEAREGTEASEGDGSDTHHRVISGGEAEERRSGRRIALGASDAHHHVPVDAGLGHGRVKGAVAGAVATCREAAVDVQSARCPGAARDRPSPLRSAALQR
jgi:hypothetical protein